MVCLYTVTQLNVIQHYFLQYNFVCNTLLKSSPRFQCFTLKSIGKFYYTTPWPELGGKTYLTTLVHAFCLSNAEVEHSTPKLHCSWYYGAMGTLKGVFIKKFAYQFTHNDSAYTCIFSIKINEQHSNSIKIWPNAYSYITNAHALSLGEFLCKFLYKYNSIYVLCKVVVSSTSSSYHSSINSQWLTQIFANLSAKFLIQIITLMFTSKILLACCWT